jgi:hypothetical protein
MAKTYSDPLTTAIREAYATVADENPLFEGAPAISEERLAEFDEWLKNQRRESEKRGVLKSAAVLAQQGIVGPAQFLAQNAAKIRQAVRIPGTPK